MLNWYTLKWIRCVGSRTMRWCGRARDLGGEVEDAWPPRNFTVRRRMPHTKSAVELFMSARVAAVAVCGIADMKAKVPESAHWLSNFGLAAIYNDFPPAEMRPFAINFIRRIHCAFVEYDHARTRVLELTKDGSSRCSPYFAALNHLEVTIAQLYLALDSVRKLANHNFFTAGDGSFEEFLNLIYNASKHQIARSDLPVWFTNEGLACAQAALTFEEVEDFMGTMAGVVKGLYNHEVPSQSLRP